MTPGAEPVADAAEPVPIHVAVPTAEAPIVAIEPNCADDAAPAAAADSTEARTTAADAIADPAAANAPHDVAAAPQSAPDAPAKPAPAQPAALEPAAVAALLKQRFPGLFSGAPKPIKLHIQADIQARAPGLFTKRVLSAFLHRHTGSTSYLIGLSKATQRFDLDGQPCGELTAEHREMAAEELTRRRNLQNERRAQEDEQRVLLEQQRFNRAGLLRDFERTTLTPSNFCVLKGVAVEELDGLLAIARRERDEPPPRPPMHATPAPQNRDRRPGTGPRDDRRPRGAPRDASSREAGARAPRPPRPERTERSSNEPRTERPGRPERPARPPEPPADAT